MPGITVGRQTSPLENILGITSGLSLGLEQIRAAREARDLRALQLLAQQPGYEVSPLAAHEAQASPVMQRLLSGQRYQPTADGAPVLNVSGVPLTVRKRAPIPLSTFFGDESAPATGGSPLAQASPGAPGASPSLDTRIAGAQADRLTRTDPSLPPASSVMPTVTQAGGVPSAAPGTPTLPQPPSQVTTQEVQQAQAVRLARKLYERQPTEENLRYVTTTMAQERQRLQQERDRAYQQQVEHFKLGRTSQKVDYGYGGLDAFIDARYGDELRRTGSRPNQAMIAQALRDEEEAKARVSAAQGSSQITQTPKGLVRVNPRTGLVETIYGPDGPLQPKPTGEEQKAASFAVRGKQAHDIAVQLEDAKILPSIGTKALERTPLGIGNYFLNAEMQQYRQAVRQFAQVVLRKESGAVINDDEYRMTDLTYFPQPGDDATVIQQKRQARETIIQQFEQEAGAAQSRTQAAPGGTTPPPGGQRTTQAPPATSQPVPRTVVKQWATKYNISDAEAEQRLRAAGYEVAPQ